MPDLPMVGKVPKGWLIAVGGGSVLVLGYVWWKHKHQAAAATSSSSTASTAPAAGGDPYPPDGTTGNPSDPNSTDPATGMTYGDEQLYNAGGGGYGGYGYGGGQGGQGSSQGSGSGSGGPPFATNAAWATYAEGQLSGIVDPTALSAAIGVYLTGRPATSDQVSLIDQAIAIAGYPPVAGPGNNPPGIVPGGGSGQVTVPNAVGQNKSAASKIITGAGLVPKVTPGEKDPIVSQSPEAGTKVAKGSTVTLTGRR